VPWFAVPTILSTGAAWYFEGPIGAGIAAGAGLLLVGAVFLITQAALNTARSSLIDRLEASAKHLRQMLTDQVQLDISTLFARFLNVLNPAQERAATQEEHMREQTERLRGLYDDFAKVEQQVRSAV
jgi:uncharacterized membrane protein YhiD involved in acid resistance